MKYKYCNTIVLHNTFNLLETIGNSKNVLIIDRKMHLKANANAKRVTLKVLYNLAMIIQKITSLKTLEGYV